MTEQQAVTTFEIDNLLAQIQQLHAERSHAKVLHQEELAVIRAMLIKSQSELEVCRERLHKLRKHPGWEYKPAVHNQPLGDGWEAIGFDGGYWWHKRRKSGE